MDSSISAADANRKFSQLLRGVREGHTYIITSHGHPIARLAPLGKHDSGTTDARHTLLARLANQPMTEGISWSRDDLYEDDR